MYAKKRVVCLVFAICFTFAIVLAGCGQAASPATDTTKAAEATTQATAAATTEAPKLDPYEINWYQIGPGPQPDVELVQAEADKYLKDKLNVTLKMNMFPWGDYDTKMKAMVSAGEPFDICFTSTWALNVFDFSRSGAFTELDPLFDQYMPHVKATMGDKLFTNSTIDGKHYSISTMKENAANYGLVVNKTVADKYGIDPQTLTTTDALGAAMKIVYAGEKNNKNFAVLSESPSLWSYFAGSYIPWCYAVPSTVGSIGPDGKTFVNQFDTPDFKNFYTIARKWYQAGYFPKDVATSTKDYQTKGNFFALHNTLKPGYAEQYNTQNKQNGWEEETVNITNPVMATSSIFNAGNAISKTSKNPERAAMFIDLFMTDPTINNLVNYGIEGKNYTKLSDTVVRPIADGGYNPNVAWEFFNSEIRYLMEAEPADLTDQYNKYNASATIAPDFGFIFNRDPIKTEDAACTNVINQYAVSLTYGVVDPEKYYPEFIAKLKAAGADKIVAEMNKQYAAFNASK